MANKAKYAEPIPEKPRTVTEKLMWAWTRDLCTRTEAEMRAEWQGEARKAIDDLDPLGFEGRLKGHCYIYYVAENFFFDNVREMPPDEAKKYLYAPFHRDIVCKALEGYLTGQGHYSSSDVKAALCLFEARDSFKSTLTQGAAALATALRELHVHKRHTRIGLVHQKEDMAFANLRRLKAKARKHKLFKRIWPEFACPYDFGTQWEFRWPCVPDGLFAEPSVIAGGMNTDFTGWHLDFLFASDMVDRDQRNSSAERKNTIVKWESLLYVMSSGGNKKVVDGTLYHGQDLHAKMLRAKKLDGTPMYHIVKHGAGGKTVGKPLTLPYRHTDDVLEQMRQEEIASSGTDEFWYMQMQCEMKSAASIVAQSSWFRDAQPKDVPANAFRVLLVDPAWKGDENAGKGCAASLQVWALVRAGILTRRYLIDGVHSRMLDVHDGKRECMRLIKKHSLTEFGIEDLGAGGYTFAPELEREAQDAYGLPITSIKLKTSRMKKDDRVQSFFKAAKAGLVYIVEGCDPTLADAMRNETDNYGQTDDKDAVDCGGYTCDPAVLDYVPEIDLDGGMPTYGRVGELPRNRTTRYCFR